MKHPRAGFTHSLKISFVAALVTGAAQFAALPAEAAQTCGLPADCPLGFCVDGFCCNTACTGDCEACSAAAKGGGVDGECGQVTEGTECKKGYCDGDSFSYIGPSKCDANGMCVQPAPIGCIGTNTCQFDLCGDDGCEHSTKLDGTDCGNGMTCNSGVCGMGSASSSSGGSGSSGSGGSGSGGMAGSGGSAGGASGGSGGVGEGGSGGQTNPYPPARDTGSCACNVVGGSFSGTTAGLLAAVGLLLRRIRRTGHRAR